MTTIDATRPRRAVSTARLARLWGEFVALYIGVPLACAFLLRPEDVVNVLAVSAAAGVILLALTPGWRWVRLLICQPIRDLTILAVFALVAAGIIYSLVERVAPWAYLSLPTQRTDLWIMIMALYPFLSALPQELLFRALFFERYGVLFGWHGDHARVPWLAIFVNSLCFGLAHLFYWNWVAVGLTAVGGLAFAYAYTRLNSFPLAFLMHVAAGQLIFTLGLGLFFYHGAIGMG
ncbi:CPBP family intramembrane glutamic endopeptidase [Dichotomicrobium thermohalophilum]|uniref:CAAX prenyl protease-like protein n=1 Tax=Dichotomicrobium thermohalophilum TaxID=933063 RepID=A0A397Q4Z3_9HYPH|nr:CPBP family intramembrane glutamic endopeptidase [Dichotomicrobium thermohalophilum]RIA56172.1 CAAX prenyl protease-like protein [Dichotomicrobium thermohalophilum]